MTGRLAPLAVALALTAAACTGGGSSNPTTSPREDLAGGTLLVGVDASQGWYGCPLLCGGPFDAMSFLSGNTMELMRCCLQRTLLSFRGTTVSEGGSVLQPDLAAAMPSISDDELTWTFTIRPDIHYAPPLQDVEVTAADFVRAFTRALSPVSNVPFTDTIGGYIANTYLRDVIEGAAPYADGSATRVSGLEAPDPNTLKIHLTRPVGDFGSRVAWSALGPIPASPARPLDPLGIAQGHDEDFGNFMVSTGPYMFEESEGSRPDAIARGPGARDGRRVRLHDAGPQPVVEPCRRSAPPGVPGSDRGASRPRRAGRRGDAEERGARRRPRLEPPIWARCTRGDRTRRSRTGSSWSRATP